MTLVINWLIRSFAKHAPNLTHLSLAYWPIPSLTPNSINTVVQSSHGPDIQYGGTNYYSHSLENDFREAADVLRRLADRLPGLQYLDLTGCTEWLRALRDRSFDWGNLWIKFRTLVVHSGIELSTSSEYCDVGRFVMAYREALLTEEMLRFWIRRSKNRGKARKTNWIDVQKDDWTVYRDLWPAFGATVEEKRKRNALLALDSKDFVGENQWTRPLALDPNAMQDQDAVERLSVWDE